MTPAQEVLKALLVASLIVTKPKPLSPLSVTEGGR